MHLLKADARAIFSLSALEFGEAPIKNTSLITIAATDLFNPLRCHPPALVPRRKRTLRLHTLA